MKSIEPECLQSLNTEFHLLCSYHGLLEIMQYPQLIIHNNSGESGGWELLGLTIDVDNNYPKDMIIIDNGELQYTISTYDLCKHLSESAIW